MLGPRRIAATLTIAALVVTLVVLREPAAARVLDLIAWVDSLGWIAPVAFVAVFALAVPSLVPAAPLLLGGGAIFGPVAGTLYGALGNLAGGTLAFTVARHLARERVERKLASHTGFEVMNRALGKEGARGVALVRLSPVLPAWLINYALGVSRIRWTHYWLGAPAILPVTVLYALTGAGLGDLATLQGGGDLDKGPGYYALLGVGVVATIVASVLLGRRARSILEEVSDEESS